ncbi:2-keto-3-deoxy-L-fuconate dehydrogenase [Rhodobium orientis]|uniref:NAD(P)-dependent oxidoreductase n=1 Tax=Rhodobium orientis TaxID=34017 RepID=A0A327JGX8_9HYPH|nr:SDR family oxidoreductase [Rhodobium orientis]MBB4304441.1 2-keto-3-deoxy-L-fuconate dehydrogenase [Rhodobium orientis]MBK5949966.1 NAD(P)-dependent oxidoreductase [Rhodobium orientis]RAI25589.1 NAD(P)-dependent oxidoreductase [Rhodobium orientis]
MSDRLAGKRALVTAAGQGIGRATAIGFAEEGAEVVATDVAPEQLEDLAALGIAKCIALDVTDTAETYAVAEELGAIDVLCNCAGYVHRGTVLDCDEITWDYCFDLNVKSMHRTIRAFLPAMLGQEKGSIINMSSGTSSIRGTPARYVYGATKAAVIGLTKAIAADFVKKGVRCNAICPGIVRTPSLEGRVAELAVELGASIEDAWAHVLESQPSGRVADPKEIADLATYLASDESAFVTGTEIVIDGGWVL